MSRGARQGGWPPSRSRCLLVDILTMTWATDGGGWGASTAVGSLGGGGCGWRSASGNWRGMVKPWVEGDILVDGECKWGHSETRVKAEGQDGSGKGAEASRGLAVETSGTRLRWGGITCEFPCLARMPLVGTTQQGSCHLRAQGGTFSNLLLTQLCYPGCGPAPL